MQDSAAGIPAARARRCSHQGLFPNNTLSTGSPKVEGGKCSLDPELVMRASGTKRHRRELVSDWD